MPEKRVVMGRHRQLLLAIPAPIRERLRISRGAILWWHLAGKKEAVVSIGRRRGPGRPRSEETCDHCLDREKELRRLRALLETTRAVDGRQFFNQGWHDALGKGLKIEAQYQLVSVRLASIEREVRALAASGVLHRRRPRGAAQPRTANPRPDPLPSEPSGGADASGGAAPQASHSDMTVQHL